MTFYISEPWWLLFLCIFCFVGGWACKVNHDYFKEEDQKEEEAEAQREAAQIVLARRNLWDANMKESEKLFEKGGAKK